jgi:hypothetical protein
MKNAVFWDVTPRDCHKNRRFERIYRLNHKGEKIKQLGTLAVTNNQLPPAVANVVANSPKTTFFIVTALTTSNFT